MRPPLQPVHLLALSAIASASVVFYAVAGFPLQVAIGLALLSWFLVDFLYLNRR